MLGFNEFIYKHIIPACFMAPMKPTFDLTDAQTVQVFDSCDSPVHHAASVTCVLYCCIPHLSTPSLNKGLARCFWR